jgi:hypothetical protein
LIAVRLLCSRAITWLAKGVQRVASSYWQIGGTAALTGINRLNGRDAQIKTA